MDFGLISGLYIITSRVGYADYTIEAKIRSNCLSRNGYSLQSKTLEEPNMVFKCLSLSNFGH